MSVFNTARRMRNKFFCAVVLTLLANAAFAQTKSASAKAPDAIQDIPRSTNVITQAAVKTGVLTCASRIEQVSSFLTSTSQAGVFLFTPPAQQDQRIFSTSLEVASPGNVPSYASASFAPNQANGCGALYETVTFWPNRCADVAAKQFAAQKQGGKLGTQTAIIEIGPTARVFLMPAADKGCIVIKKEILS